MFYYCFISCDFMITLYTLFHIINIKQMSNRKLVVDGTARYQPLIFTVDYFILL